jgi:monofunctional glycosyltransferase
MQQDGKNRSLGRRMGTWAYRLVVWPLLVLALAIGVGAFAPLPSTLMLKRWVTGQPVKRDWIAFERIAPALPRAVVASEDQLFCTHWGVDFDVLREILSDPDGPDRGGSTISMQTVKNVFLWHGRSYVRKALEIPIALAADTVWGKRRVMELYLNVAEWGDGVFGAEAASQFYFQKSAAQLSASEAARLAAALPNPEQRGSSRPTRASQRVLRRMGGVEGYLGCLR